MAESRYIGAGDAWITSRRVQWASRVNREFAAPAAQALADANARVLEDAVCRYQGRWLLGAAGGFIALAALAAVLVLAQLWLARRTRRLVNPAAGCGHRAVRHAGAVVRQPGVGRPRTLRAAKQDAYDSLHVLFEAKSAVSAIRADMSLWLLDPAVRAEAQQRIAAAEQSLIGDASHDPAAQRALTAALPAALAAEQAGDPGGHGPRCRQPAGCWAPSWPTSPSACRSGRPAAAAVTRPVRGGRSSARCRRRRRRTAPCAVARWLGGRRADAFAAEQAALDRRIAVNQAEFDAEHGRRRCRRPG